jgi:uncharacterized protein YbjT (DUF2867 family)
LRHFVLDFSPEAFNGVAVSTNRILVIGATGRTGREVVSQLLEAGVPVRALVRAPETARLPAATEVNAGDLTRPDTLDACFDAVDTVFLVWCAPAQTLAPAMDRILKHARRIVYLSAPYKTLHPLFQAAQPNPVTALHAEIERRIEASGCRWTFLRPGMFAANAVNWWAPTIRAGDVVRWPYLAASTAPIDERDIAAVAVRALLEDSHAGAEYVLTGPESLSQFEQIATIADVTGRPVRIEEIPPDEARRDSFAGMPGRIANMLLDAWAAAAGQSALVTSSVAGITGAPPRTFREWVIDHVSQFRS